MTATCPNGHTSTADDYCDVCGAPIDATASPPSAAPAAPAGTDAPPAAPVATGQTCPDCSTQNAADALFCEGCGYDFTTKTSAQVTTTPASSAAGPTLSTPPAMASGWVAEVWIDPAWYAAQDSDDAMPSPGLPVVVPLTHTSILIGRKSKSRNIHPEIDCESDTAASRRQAQLTTDGTRWWVEDLQSANGTYVGAASAALPEEPIPVGPKLELQPDDRIYVGAWTRVVIRRATDDEHTSLTPGSGEIAP